MLFRKRATTPEYFDDPARTFAEISNGYRELARVNRLFHAADPYTRVLARWLGHDRCRKLSILDIGAGDGWIGNEMARWARELGWDWRIVNLDFNAASLSLNRAASNVVGSALALPFRDNSFDIVIASQMAHHLDAEADVLRHMREAWRVARHGIFLTDLHRSAFLYAMLWTALGVLRISPQMARDGLLSVRRSWTRHEWEELARRSAIPGATVRGYFG